VQPSRVVDTRVGIGALSAPVAPGGTLVIAGTGAGGVPSTGVSAVVLNVTATDTTSAGFLTVYPTGIPLPELSNVNFGPGQTVANAATVQVGDGGQLSVFNAFGNTHVIIDIQGWYDDTGSGGGRFNPVGPGRILDTRNGIGPWTGSIGADTRRELDVTGQFGVPESGVSAVVLNLTATNQTSDGYLSVWPANAAEPDVSNLNFRAGRNVANLVTVGVDPTTGAVSIGNEFGTTDVIVDILGWYDAAGVQGQLFHAIAPHRFYDTRPDKTATPGSGGRITITDAPPLGATAVVLNVTVTNTTQAGYLTVIPEPGAPGPIPDTSTVNWNEAGATVANLAITGLSSQGNFLYYNRFGGTDVVVDGFGYFSAT
jgi:hypothetical protein